MNRLTETRYLYLFVYSWSILYILSITAEFAEQACCCFIHHPQQRAIAGTNELTRIKVRLIDFLPGRS